VAGKNPILFPVAGRLNASASFPKPPFGSSMPSHPPSDSLNIFPRFCMMMIPYRRDIDNVSGPWLLPPIPRASHPAKYGTHFPAKPCYLPLWCHTPSQSMRTTTEHILRGFSTLRRQQTMRNALKVPMSRSHWRGGVFTLTIQPTSRAEDWQASSTESKTAIKVIQDEED
jgi:hypothetical protein